EAERDGILRQYCHQLCSVVAIDTAAAEASIQLRRQCRARLPMVDALIAGCALLHGLVLVHRDDHLSSIPKAALRQVPLPARGTAGPG
ncbi:MAG: PIN domain-containing protein, partial [Verrucomicrobiota bacterium]